MEETGQELQDLVVGERLPATEGYVNHVVEEASKRPLCYPSTGVEVGRELVEEAAEKPGLTGAHEASDDSYHIPHVQTAGVEGFVDDLLGLLITQRS